MDAGVTIWGKGITFTAGIPILVSSGLFSFGCMVRVVGRETAAAFLCQFYASYSDVLVPPTRPYALTARPQRFHFGSHFKV